VTDDRTSLVVGGPEGSGADATAPGPATRGERWYALSAEAVAERLATDVATGLTSAEAARRISEHGPNALAQPPRRPRILLFLDQFRSLIVYVLVAAAVLAAAVGDFKDPIAIAAVLLVNGVIGFVQTHRAERSMEALKRMLVVHAQVRRDGRLVSLPSEELVPGDVVLLDAGDRVPADGRLALAASLSIDESALTGESVPVEKVAEPIADLDLPISEHVNLAFMNTAVARGRGELLVTRTGMATEIGKVAGLLASVGQQSTPLQRRLDAAGRRIAVIAGLASATVLGVVLAQGDAWSDAVLTAVALAVAAIPEGLPAVVAVTLAVGAHRMAQRNAIVKRLASVETLGCASVVCTDKTGTLTLNQMTARAVVVGQQRAEVEGHGYELSGAISSAGRPIEDLAQRLVPGVLCNDTSIVDADVVGDPTEAALIVLAHKAGIDLDALADRFPRCAEVPFDSAHKFMATFHREEASPAAGVLLCVKGAPEVLIGRCTAVHDDDGLRPLDESRAATLASELDELTARGLRVLAIAHRRLGDEEYQERLDDQGLFELIDGLELDALVGILDPPRPEARDAIGVCHTAGIDVKMITGDHAVTARSVARALGISGDVLTGADLDAMTVEDLAARIGSVGVFARVAPEHKVAIVEALRRNGHVVAMTGDGVNDAPSLKAADIGVAMGIAGTDVTKEAAEMVLADDNFATIVHAVERGRTIYDNILKFVLRQLSTNVGAIGTILGARLLGLPTPFTPIQMLWVNLITDGPPAVALGLDPPAPDVMQRPPRATDEAVITRQRLARVGFLGSVIAASVITLFGWARDRYGTDTAVTMAFTTFVFAQAANAFNVRSERSTAFGRQSLTNRFLWLATVGVVALQVAAVELAALNGVFDTTPLSLAQWATCAAVATTILVAEELRKLVSRRRAASTGRS